MATTDRAIRLRLTCEAPPVDPRIAFGLQDDTGTLAPGTVAPDGTLRFEAECRAVTLAAGSVRLRGPIVHGPSSAPFLYLSCRPDGTTDAPWIFRLKVPLRGLVAQLGDGDPAIEPVRFEGRVRATGGGSAPLLGDGWERR